MNLTATTMTVEVVLSEAATTTNCAIVASYADASPTLFLLGENDLLSNGTVAVTAVASPAFDIQRQVKEITVYNADTVPHTITLRLNNNGTFRPIRKQTIGVGSTFLYAPDLVTPSGGTVTEIDTANGVAGGPITNSGTITLSTIAGSSILANSTSLTATPAGTPIGSGLSFSSGTLTATGSGGTVTTVATSGSGISGGPITTAGTLTVSWNGGTVTSVNPNQLTTAGSILSLITGPTIQAVQATSPLFVNGGTNNPALSTPTLLLLQNDGTVAARFTSINIGIGSAWRGYTALGSFLTPAAIGAATVLGGFQGFGYNGSAWSANAAATLFFSGNGAWTTTSNPTKVQLGATPTGSTATAVNVVTVLGDGRVLVNTTTDNGSDTFQVAGSSTQTQVKRTTVTAAAGYVGEYVSSTVTAGAAITMTSGTVTSVTSISLTAGDWDIWGEVCFTANAATTATLLQGSVTTVSTALATAPGLFTNENVGGVTFATLGADVTLPIPGIAVSPSTTTAYYLPAKAAFALSTLNAYGIIQARRR